MQALQTALFNYADLDTETCIVVQQRTGEIKAVMKRAARDIIEIGEKLSEVKARLGYGKFGEWLESEFEWSERTARQFMTVADTFKSANFADLQIAPSALYLLAAPSTPDAARDEAIARAEAGETITHSTARDIVAEHKAPPVPFVPTATDYADFYGDDEPELWAPPVNDGDRLAVISGLPPRPASHQLINQSVSNEWYTPREYTDAARELMGGIDTDPASNEQANGWINADTYYTKATNGFDKPWRGRVWMNPPYGKEDGDSNQSRWTARLIAQWEAGITVEAVCLVNAVPGNLWFAPLWDFPICFVARRIRFTSAEGELGDPTHSNVLVYLPDHGHRHEQIARFVRIFSAFGPVAAKLHEYDGQVFMHGLEV